MARGYRQRFLLAWLLLTVLWILGIVLFAFLHYREHPVIRMQASDMVDAGLLLAGIPAAILVLGLALIWVVQGFRATEPDREVRLLTHRPAEPATDAAPRLPFPAEVDKLASLETDPATLLRRNLAALDGGLRELKRPAETPCSEPNWDVAAEDAEGNVVVIAFEAGTADPGAVGRLLACMGAFAETDPRPVRGILVARDFQPGTRQAGRTVPGLALRRYGIGISFEKG